MTSKNAIQGGYAAVKVGRAGALQVSVARRVARNLVEVDASLRPDMKILFVFDGFDRETRQPDEIPELAAYVREVAQGIGMETRSEAWGRRLMPATRLLMLRCAARGWGAPVVRLNDAGPVPWRHSDLPGGGP